MYKAPENRKLGRSPSAQEHRERLTVERRIRSGIVSLIVMRVVGFGFVDLSNAIAI